MFAGGIFIFIGNTLTSSKQQQQQNKKIRNEKKNRLTNCRTQFKGRRILRHCCERGESHIGLKATFSNVVQFFLTLYV